MSQPIANCSFNDEFGDLYYVQKQLAIPDTNLRAEIRRNILHQLMAPYTAFWDKYGTLKWVCRKVWLLIVVWLRYSRSGFTKNDAKYLKYPPSSLQQMVSTFFR